jgi:cellulose synthase/poly-beta-1,6-N-acetylglucosamine synthase-like glycosyltransferase
VLPGTNSRRISWPVSHPPVDVSVVIPTHAPHPGRLHRTLANLRAQTLPVDRWETLLVDNGSLPAVDPALFAQSAPANLRVVREPRLGLAWARKRGLMEACAGLAVFVDDDNLLAPDYLGNVVSLFAQNPRVGAIGGRSVPEFERAPAAWHQEFFNLLALRDLGDNQKISNGLRPSGSARNEYPAGSAPIGAGMAVRLEALQAWLDDSVGGVIPDRAGGELSSGGDNDIVLSMMEHGWEVGYFPELSLTHLIPAWRLDSAYLARLNRGIQKSWMQVLTMHDANPWPSIPRWKVPLRQLKAWFTYRAWSGAAARVRWQGACGHFEGRKSG